jgi:hypothetical protein
MITPAALSGVRYLVDTNVLSEIARTEPDRNVILWFDRVGFAKVALAAPTLLEIRYGIEQRPPGRRRDLLEMRLLEFIEGFLGGRIAPFGRDEAEACGRIMANKRALGESLDDHLADAMIAACAMTAGLAVATRNEREFRNTGVKLVNPWAPTGRRRA